MTIIHDQHQMGTDTARGERAWGLCRLAPEADHPQDWRAFESRFRPSPSRTVNTGGGVTTSRLLRLFPLPHSAWRALTPERSRFSGFVLPTVQGNRVKSQRTSLCGALSLLKHASCQGTDAFEGHSSTPLSVVGFNANRHSERRNGTVPYSAGNLPNRKGARPDERG